MLVVGVSFIALMASNCSVVDASMAIVSSFLSWTQSRQVVNKKIPHESCHFGFSMVARPNNYLVGPIVSDGSSRA